MKDRWNMARDFAVSEGCDQAVACEFADFAVGSFPLASAASLYAAWARTIS